MDAIAAQTALREREPLVWPFAATGIIAGGVFGAVVGFGITLQFLAPTLVAFALATIFGWAAGAAGGGLLGVAGARLTERIRGQSPGGRQGAGG